MAVGFTDEQKTNISAKLLTVGSDLAGSVGFKNMTIAQITKAAGIATGTFYHFYKSKEEFAVALMRDIEEKSFSMLLTRMMNSENITLEEFLKCYRDLFRPENNFLLRLKLNDWVWLKTHISDGSYFENKGDLERIKGIIPYITGVRKNFDLGVVINLIKSVYAIYQNRESFFEGSLDTTVDLIFETLYNYVKE